MEIGIRCLNIFNLYREGGAACPSKVMLGYRLCPWSKASVFAMAPKAKTAAASTKAASVRDIATPNLLTAMFYHICVRYVWEQAFVGSKDKLATASTAYIQRWACHGPCVWYVDSPSMPCEAGLRPQLAKAFVVPDSALERFACHMCDWKGYKGSTAEMLCKHLVNKHKVDDTALYETTLGRAARTEMMDDTQTELTELEQLYTSPCDNKLEIHCNVCCHNISKVKCMRHFERVGPHPGLVDVDVHGGQMICATGYAQRTASK